MRVEAHHILHNAVEHLWPDLPQEARACHLTNRLSYPDSAQNTVHGFMGVENPYPVCASRIDPEALPYRMEQFSHVLLTHMLEFTHHPLELMSELFRILEPEGKAIVIVANRAGLWARKDGTLLGDGQPYSYAQLCSLIEQSRFTMIRSRQCLLTPPVENRKIFSALASIIEPVSAFCPVLCGVHVVEIQKKVHGLPPGYKKRTTKGLWVGKPAVPGL